MSIWLSYLDKGIKHDMAVPQSIPQALRAMKTNYVTTNTSTNFAIFHSNQYKIYTKLISELFKQIDLTSLFLIL